MSEERLLIVVGFLGALAAAVLVQRAAAWATGWLNDD